MMQYGDYFTYAIKKDPSGETVALFEDMNLAIEFCDYQATFLGNHYEVWKRHIGCTDDYEKSQGQRVYPSY